MAGIYEKWRELSDKINREIPIEDVLALHGIHPVSKGKYRLRDDDDTPSASIYRAKNQITDFGAANSFNCCSFTAWYTGVSYKEATASLAEKFGYEIPEREKQEVSNKLSNWEWAKLHIHGDMVSKNMTFHPESYGEARTHIYADNYRISMSELKERGKTVPEDMSLYTSILKTQGFPHVIGLKTDYFAGLYNWYALYKDVQSDVVASDITLDKEFYDNAKELTLVESIFAKAIEDTELAPKFKPRVYNAERDFQKVVNGEIAFDIGPHAKYEINRKANQEKAKVFNCFVSREEYYKLVENGLDNILYAAKQKGNMVLIEFVSTDSGRVNYLVRALRGKERNIIEGLNMQDVPEQQLTDDRVIPSGAETRAEKPSSQEPHLGIN